MGVVNFYAVTMKILGMDPLIPLYVNSILTYIAVLTVSVFLGKSNSLLTKYGWLLVLIPEFIYFNIMPHRDILCMAFMSICVTKLSDYSRLQDKILLLLSFSLLFYIRPTMALPIILAQFCIFFFKSKARTTRIVYTILFLSVVFLMQRIEGVMSTENNENIESRIERSTTMAETDEEQSSSGLSSLLIPHNPVEYIVFGFIRSFLYVIPSPGIFFSPINALSMEGQGQAPGPPNLTTILLFLCVPLILKLVYHKRYKDPNIQLIFTTTMVYFFVVGTFNTTIIHPRYRVVYDLLFMGLALWQFTSKKKKTKSLPHKLI